jgi:hypothetical protein
MKERAFINGMKETETEGGVGEKGWWTCPDSPDPPPK